MFVILNKKHNFTQWDFLKNPKMIQICINDKGNEGFVSQVDNLIFG